MPGGRPEQGRQQVHPELAELSSWLRQALADAGFTSVNAFVQRHPFDKNQIYGLFKGTRFLSLESTQSVAVALRRKAEEVEPLWWRAKEAMERAVLAQHNQTALRLKSWADLPWPELALQDILEAQSRAVEQLPYRLLGVEAPPLSMVYVRQQARLQSGIKPERPGSHGDQADERDSQDSSPPDSVVEIAEALNRHEHLLVTGEPGAGKSTFGHFFALRLSRIWLRQDSGGDAPLGEPVAPLRVPARALVGSASWSTALAEATCQTLAMRLVASPAPTLFERPVQGARWLIIVDGLDEIVDRVARREVIRAVAAHCRMGGPYRIVVTSRELPDAELAPLRAQHLGHYTIEPFGREQLEMFARQWFTAQDVDHASEAAARFLRQADDSRLRDLVRNPLLATIAAISHTLEPERPLPPSRLELYERFFAYLLDEEASGREMSAEFHRLESANPTKYLFAEWVYQHRAELVRHLGLTRLESELPLHQTASEWVKERVPHGLHPSPSWNDDLQQVLIGTGLFVYEGDTLRFLHHSFAEYLAAADHAERIDAAFPDLDSWITRGLKDADRGFVLFLFAMWSRRPENNISLILHRLLAGNPARVLLAGRLLAETSATPKPDADLVIDRLVNLAIGNAVLEQSGRVADAAGRVHLTLTPVSSIMEVLGTLVENQTVVQRLTTLAGHPRLPMLLRVDAAAALGRVAGTANALPLLKQLVPSARDADVIRIARALLDHDPQDPLVTTLLVQLGQDALANPTSRADAANELAILGNAAAAATCKEVIQDVRLDGYALRTVVQAWLRCVEERERPAVVDTARRRSSQSVLHRIQVSEAFAEAGLRPDAHKLAALALTDPTCPSWRLDDAIAAYLSTTDHADPRLVLDAVQDRRSPSDRSWIARGLAEAGHTKEAASVALEVILDPRADGYDISNAVRGWLTGADEATRATMSKHLERRAANSVDWSGRVLGALADAGGRDQAVAVAKCLITDPGVGGQALQDIAGAWLEIAGTAAHEELRRLVDQRPARDAWGTTFIAETCAEHGLFDLAIQLARHAISSSADQPFYMITAAKAWIAASGPIDATAVLAAINEVRPSAGDRAAVADHFAAAGALEGAQRQWRDIVVSPDATIEYRLISAARLMETGVLIDTIWEPTERNDMRDEPWRHQIAALANAWLASKNATDGPRPSPPHASGD